MTAGHIERAANSVPCVRSRWSHPATGIKYSFQVRVPTVPGLFHLRSPQYQRRYYRPVQKCVNKRKKNNNQFVVCDPIRSALAINDRDHAGGYNSFRHATNPMTRLESFDLDCAQNNDASFLILIDTMYVLYPIIFLKYHFGACLVLPCNNPHSIYSLKNWVGFSSKRANFLF